MGNLCRAPLFPASRSIRGVVVGADAEQEWLLPWWWQHYAAHNRYPLLFADFGLSPHMRSWCRGKGRLSSPLAAPVRLCREGMEAGRRRLFEQRYGEGVWMRRGTWFKKPLALQLAPFDENLWLDADCQVQGELAPLFDALGGDAEIALARDREQSHDFLLPGEVNYNSGVIAFRKGARLLSLWQESASAQCALLPGDQEVLSRAIFLHEVAVAELSPLHNWYRALGHNSEALVTHYCGGPAKVEILTRLLA